MRDSSQFHEVRGALAILGGLLAAYLCARGWAIWIAQSLDWRGSSLTYEMSFYRGRWWRVFWLLWPNNSLVDFVAHEGALLLSFSSLVLVVFGILVLDGDPEHLEAGRRWIGGWVVALGAYVLSIGADGALLLVTNYGLEGGVFEIIFPDSLALIIWWAWPAFLLAGTGCIFFGRFIWRSVGRGLA
jgi:hypothetical protein